jgi:hypothetical protein
MVTSVQMFRRVCTCISRLLINVIRISELLIVYAIPKQVLRQVSHFEG